MNAKTETTIVPSEVAAAGQQNVAAEASQALAIAQAYVIDCPEMYEAAADELKDIKAKYNRIDAARKKITQPMDAAKKAVMDFFRAPLENLEKAERSLKGSMLAYQQAEATKAAKAQREAEQRAAEERRALEAQQREAEKKAQEAMRAGDTSAAQAAVEVAEAVREQRELAEVAPVAALATAAPKASGISMRDNWKARVDDFKALVIEAAKRAQDGDDFLLSMLEPNQSALDVAAKGMKAHLNIPGVTAYNDQTIAARSK